MKIIRQLLRLLYSDSTQVYETLTMYPSKRQLADCVDCSTLKPLKKYRFDGNPIPSYGKQEKTSGIYCNYDSSNQVQPICLSDRQLILWHRPHDFQFSIRGATCPNSSFRCSSLVYLSNYSFILGVVVWRKLCRNAVPAWQGALVKHNEAIRDTKCCEHSFIRDIH